MAEFSSKYGLGDFVYIITDVAQDKYIVTGVFFTPIGVTYTIACGVNTHSLYEMEISSEKDNTLALGISTK